MTMRSTTNLDAAESIERGGGQVGGAGEEGAGLLDLVLAGAEQVGEVLAGVDQVPAPGT